MDVLQADFPPKYEHGVTQKINGNSAGARQKAPFASMSVRDSATKQKLFHSRHHPYSPRRLEKSAEASPPIKEQLLPGKGEELDPNAKMAIQKAKPRTKISYKHEKHPTSLVEKVMTDLHTLPMGSRLRKFKLRNCGVTSKILAEISNEIELTKITIIDLDFSGNKGLDLDVVQKLKDQVHADVLNLSDTELNAKNVEKLGNMQQVKELILNYKAFVDDAAIVGALAKPINNGLEKLSLVDSQITGQQLVAIAEALEENILLQVLDLSHVMLGEDGVEAVAKIANKTEGMKKLGLSDCDICEEDLRILENKIKTKITAIDLSSNKLLVEGDLEAVASLAHKLDAQELDMSNLSLRDKDIDRLLASKTSRQISKVWMNENPGIHPVAVGKLVAEWEIKDLDLSDCRLSSPAIKSLATCFGDQQLEWLNISDPDGKINDEKRQALSALERKVKNLFY